MGKKGLKPGPKLTFSKLKKLALPVADIEVNAVIRGDKLAFMGEDYWVYNITMNSLGIKVLHLSGKPPVKPTK